DDPDEHAGARASEIGRTLAGVLESLPCNLEQQALLRIHAGRLPRRDAEELGVEAIQLVEEPSPARADLSFLLRIRIVQPGDRPAVLRDLRDGVLAAAHEVPQFLRSAHAAGEAAADADDRDGLARSAIPRRQLRLEALDRDKSPLQRRQFRPRTFRTWFHSLPIRYTPSRFRSSASASSSDIPETRSTIDGAAVAAPRPARQSGGAVSGAAGASPSHSSPSRYRATASTVG